ncbi:MAG: hypothetical protein ABIF10_07435 [Candidatus Woesearchaeota archaeon]
MKKKIISLSIDDSVYLEYNRLCRQQGIVMSKQIENFMREIVRQLRR